MHFSHYNSETAFFGEKTMKCATLRVYFSCTDSTIDSTHVDNVGITHKIKIEIIHIFQTLRVLRHHAQNVGSFGSMRINFHVCVVRGNRQRNNNIKKLRRKNRTKEGSNPCTLLWSCLRAPLCWILSMCMLKQMLLSTAVIISYK